ncbi:hypothetical protein ACX43S_23915 [Enterobacter cloacae]
MQISKRRSDAIYLTEMGAFIARRISMSFVTPTDEELKEAVRRLKKSL